MAIEKVKKRFVIMTLSWILLNSLQVLTLQTLVDKGTCPFLTFFEFTKFWHGPGFEPGTPGLPYQLDRPLDHHAKPPYCTSNNYLLLTLISLSLSVSLACDKSVIFFPTILQLRLCILVTLKIFPFCRNGFASALSTGAIFS